jgi:hypothetical protein
LPIVTVITRNEKDEFLVKLDVPQLRLNKYTKGVGVAQTKFLALKKENQNKEKLLDSKFTVMKEEITGSKELTCIFDKCSMTFKRSCKLKLHFSTHLSVRTHKCTF